MNDHPDLTPDPSLQNMPEGTVVLDDLSALEFVRIGRPGHAVVGMHIDDRKRGSLIVPMTPELAFVVAANLARIAAIYAEEAGE